MDISHPIPLAPGLGLVTISSEGRSCHLILEGESSLLINCLPGLTPARIREAGHPAPDEIWHTHIDTSLAGEGRHFPVPVRLPSGFAEVAADSECYRREIRTTWKRPDAWMDTLGRERFGIAGSTVLHPPPVPLDGFHVFDPGDTLQWHGLSFRVVDLSVRRFYAVGFALMRAEETLALFSGELVTAKGNLPDAWGFEANYAGLPWEKIARTLREIAAENPQWICPSFGDPMPEPATRLADLADRMEKFLETVHPHEPRAVGAPAKPGAFGRYYDHGDSVYQIAGFGNVILLVHPNGTGLMVDPGPCDFENPRRKEQFLADLEKFEREAGLRAVDLVLLTHFHGDHYDLWPLVRERYPGCKLAAWRPVADIIEKPAAFPYPCLLPWYDAGWETCRVDITTSRREPLCWQGVDIHTVHLPGHCLVHAGYWLDWQGRRLLFSGDSIQTPGETDRLQLIPCNHSIPGTSEGHAQAHRTAAGLHIALNLGGHSSHFSECERVYKASQQNLETATASLMNLFGDKSPWDIFLPPFLRPAAERMRNIIRNC